MTNWKVIVGSLLVLGGLIETVSIINHPPTAPGSTSGPAIFGALTLVAVGIFIVIKGRKKKTL